MTREHNKAFLGFECDPSLSTLVKADALRKGKTTSAVLRDLVTRHYLSSITPTLKGSKEENVTSSEPITLEFEGRK